MKIAIESKARISLSSSQLACPLLKLSPALSRNASVPVDCGSGGNCAAAQNRLGLAGPENSVKVVFIFTEQQLNTDEGQN